MPLCLTFISLKKAFDSLGLEAVVEAFDNQGVLTHPLENTVRKLEWVDMGVKVENVCLPQQCNYIGKTIPFAVYCFQHFLLVLLYWHVRRNFLVFPLFSTTLFF
ncbi:hypothetical protein RB195_024000 [Necator americanus]|uniref:Reverse transcriptase domain-containing protein n=1 Tax=Necator americanus TaxID=51031 RepID=A0ABR1ELJ5_NECAM